MDFIVGILIGALLYWLFVDRKKVSGALVFTIDNPESDEFVNVEFYEDLNDIYSKKNILLKVSHR